MSSARQDQIVPVMDYTGNIIMPLCSNCGECIYEHEISSITNVLVCKDILSNFNNPNLTLKEMKLIADKMR